MASNSLGSESVIVVDDGMPAWLSQNLPKEVESDLEIPYPCMSMLPIPFNSKSIVRVTVGPDNSSPNP